MNQSFIIDRSPSDSDKTDQLQERLTQFLEASPIPRNEMIDNLPLFTSLPALRRFLYFNHLYQQIRNVPGNVFVFGVRWGRDLAVLQVLRDLYESHYHARRILGFDTFEGFLKISEKDLQHAASTEGAFSVTQGYETFLADLLRTRDSTTRFSHMQRTELIKGDAPVQLEKYLQAHPETCISMVYFDMDLYEPTRDCARLLLPFLTPGAVVAFDEVMHPRFPGETTAAREVFGNNLPLQHFEIGPSYGAYLIFNP